ncbi:hypothetical protein EN871_12580 [bacterium M00.F.Ca.ET.228.01.1.1]|nr:hypothetical protein EN871_12580 [bacterium M00.F.Ca.ET.228.01.1.1]TGS01528.1 hypothetical protein EN834_12575 [bacterium M00.F.Ca.ET.191.01.1.1]TGU08866.1 hypothetical protein EN798_06955 [bacterium M00.F.Ca.ET.155.01.1.1]
MVICVVVSLFGVASSTTIVRAWAGAGSAPVAVAIAVALTVAGAGAGVGARAGAGAGARTVAGAGAAAACPDCAVGVAVITVTCVASPLYFAAPAPTRDGACAVVMLRTAPCWTDLMSLPSPRCEASS